MTLIMLTALTLAVLSGCKKQQPVYEASEFEVTDTITVETSIFDEFTQDDSLKLTAYDTPPVPIHNPLPAYPNHLRKTGIQGVVVLEVIVLKDGTVSDARVTKSLLAGEGGLDETAISAVRAWRFKPALLNRKPVQSKVAIPVSFSLRS